MTQQSTTENPRTIQNLQGRLRRKLLRLGGSRVAWFTQNPHLAEVVARGQLFSLPVRKIPGRRNRCHSNAASEWGQDINGCQLVTGYALPFERLCWIPHSWIVTSKVLYETTVKMEKYFGVLLSQDEALKFWLENFLWEVYQGPMSLMTKMVEELARESKQAPDIPGEQAK